MTLSTLAQIRSKMEKAEKLLEQRRRNQEVAFFVTFTSDTQEQIQAKIDAALNGREREKLVLYELRFDESAVDFTLPVHGQPRAAREPQETANSEMLEELTTFKQAEQASEMRHMTADEKLEAKALGIEPDRTGLTRRADRVKGQGPRW